MEHSLFRHIPMGKSRSRPPAFCSLHPAWFSAVCGLVICASTCAWSKETFTLDARQMQHLVVLVSQLGSDDFDVRESAHRKLIAYGPSARALLVRIRDTVEDWK